MQETSSLTFLHDPLFWYSLSFIIFLAIAWIMGRKPIGDFLDNYAVKVRQKMIDATKIHEEATRLLAETQTKHSNAVIEVNAILNKARHQSQLIREQSESELDALVKLRQKQADDRIRILEDQTYAEIRNTTITTALKATEFVLKDKLNQAEDEKLLAGQISSLTSGLKKVA